MDRIKPSMTASEAIGALSERNKVAEEALIKLIAKSPSAVSDTIQLDQLGIYGFKLERLWKFCGKKVEIFQSVIQKLRDKKISKEELEDMIK